MNMFMLNLTYISCAERRSGIYRPDVRWFKVYCLVDSSLPSNVLIFALRSSLVFTVLVSKKISNHSRGNEKDHAFLPHYPYDSISSIIQNAGHAPLIEQPSLLCSPCEKMAIRWDFPQMLRLLHLLQSQISCYQGGYCMFSSQSFHQTRNFCRPLQEHLTTSLAINYYIKVSKTATILK